MSAFKQGDRVRCVDVGYNRFIKAGGVYTVVEDQFGDRVKIQPASRGEQYYYAHRFELVTELAQHKTNDAPTSVAAAVSIKPKKTSIKDVILELLDTYKTGLTGQEIAEYSGIRLNSVTPRFAQLSRWSGSPYQKEAPKIADTGRTRSGQIVWVLYGTGRGPDGT